MRSFCDACGLSFNLKRNKLQVAHHASLLVDAFLLYALSVNKSLGMGNSPDDGTAISNAMFGTHFVGKYSYIFSASTHINFHFIILPLNVPLKF